jgi:transcriptional regulator with XRE-family HTH domain
MVLMNGGAVGSGTIGEAVRRARQARRLSQEKLALLIDTDQTTISQIERGRFKPRYETLLALAGALQLDPEALLGLAGFRLVNGGKNGTDHADQGDIFDRAPLARLDAELRALPTAPGAPTFADDMAQFDRLDEEKRARVIRRVARDFLWRLREELEREEGAG